MAAASSSSSAASAPAASSRTPPPQALSVFYTAATDGCIRTFDVRAPTCVAVVHVQGAGATTRVPVLGMAVMPEFHALATASSDARVRVWDTRTMTSLLAFAHPTGRSFTRCDARLGGILAGDIDGHCHWFPTVPFSSVL